MSSKCRSCGAAIVWIRTEAGKAMPVDAAPAAGGSIYLNDDGTGLVLKSEDVAKTVSTLGEVLHKSHFATCPGAAQHRKPRKE